MFRKTNRTTSRTRRGRPTPAMAVACAALFMSLGGVGYAAATIGSSQIKNNSVQGKDIKNSTVQGKDIKNGTVKDADIAEATRNALKGQTGAQGPGGATGAPGQPGVQGLTGPRGPSNLRVVADADIDVPTCAGALTTCTALLSRSLEPGSWLIQAKFLLDNNDDVKTGTTDNCGIVSSVNGVVVDTVRVPSLGVTGQAGEAEVVSLSGSLTTAGATVSVRCNEQAGESLFIEDAKITALQVESVTIG